MNNTKKLKLLVGSGISFEAGMPKSIEIDWVLRNGHEFGLRKGCKKKYKGKIVYGKLDKDYAIKNDKDHCVKSLNDIRDLRRIQLVYRYIGRYLVFSEHNYEDIVDVMIELENYNQKTYNKRIYESYYNRLMKKFNMDNEELWRFIGECIRYCKFVIQGLLSPDWINSSLDYLEIIKELNQNFGKIDIFTLNHDLVLEKYFEKKEIEYYSGYKMIQDDFYEFDINEYGNDKPFNLYKLHGSIDIGFFSDNERKFYGKSKIDVGGIGYMNITYEPIILTGTYGKFEEYQKSIYADLACRFKDRSKEADYFIISGYGFNDAGINYTLINAMECNPEMKIIMIGKNKEELTTNRRDHVISNILAWEKYKRLFWIEECFEKVTLEEIEEYISK